MEEEIMQITGTFPGPGAGSNNAYTDEIYPGVNITGGPGQDKATLVGIDTREAELPFNPRLIEGLDVEVFDVEEYNPDWQRYVNEQGVFPKYMLDYAADTNPNYPPLFQDEPIPGRSKRYHLRFYFDVFGNYLKEIFTNDHDLNLDLEELTPQREKTIGKFTITHKHYKSEMTPGDFELVGFSLKLLKDNLLKAKEETT